MRAALPLGLTFQDYPEDDAHAITVFIPGCRRGCPGCQNPSLAGEGGENCQDIPARVLAEVVEASARRNYTDKVVLTGGDPLDPANVKSTKELLGLLKSRGLSVAVYTGAMPDEVKASGVTGFDYVKCGPFLESKRNPAAGKRRNGRPELASLNQQWFGAALAPLN